MPSRHRRDSKRPSGTIMKITDITLTAKMVENTCPR